MIPAVLHGKHVFDEDQLTSTVFSLFSYIRHEILLSWLARTRPFGAMQTGLQLASVSDCQMVFWPRTRSHGIPDVLLVLRDEHGDARHIVVVEAKYGASKTQWGDPTDMNGQLDSGIGDQLVRYWRGLVKHDFMDPDIPRSAASRTVIYLTTDSAPPVEAVQESVQRSHGEIRLGWLSWRDAWDVLPDPDSVSSMEARLVHDIRNLLEYLGLTCFRSFTDSRFRDPVTLSLWFFGSAQMLSDAGNWPKVNESLWRLSR